MAATRTTRVEMETTITFNRHLGRAECCTADPAAARRWRRFGWPVEVLGRYPDGKPRTWQAAVPWRVAVRFGRLRDRPGKSRSPLETPRSEATTPGPRPPSPGTAPA